MIGVETVVVAVVHRIIQYIVHQGAERLVREGDRTIAPYAVEQVVHTTVRVLGRSGAGLDGTGVVGSQAHVQFVPAYHRIHTCLQTFITGVQQHTVLVIIRKRGIVADAFRTTAQAQVMVVLECRAENLICQLYWSILR